MIDLLRILLALLMALCLILGWWAGRWWERRYGKPKIKDTGPLNSWIAPDHMVRLHYLGSLDERRFKRLCNWIADGRQYRLTPLTNAKVLSRTQYEKVRSEMLERHLAIQAMNKTISITRPGMSFFLHHAGRSKPANNK
jgi:uncharacterized protein YneF (UPF0154 family)